jgi:hypothetical protein
MIAGEDAPGPFPCAGRVFFLRVVVKYRTEDQRIVAAMPGY